MHKAPGVVIHVNKGGIKIEHFLLVRQDLVKVKYNMDEREKENKRKMKWKMES
jgi:hypothetical protein